ncbi:Mitochondrial transcription rescue factor 1 [Formica fusca]
MLSRATINIIRRTICNNARTFYYVRNFLESNLLTHDSNTKEYNIQNHYNLYVAKRFKSNRRKIVDNKKSRDEDSDEEEEENEEVPAGSKMLTINVPSLRLDTISKAGFGISRNKVEEAFYASKFRVNGNKVFKKSMEVEVGNEIDIVSHRHLDNPKFLIVNRIVILSMTPTSNSIRMKLSRDKNLLIEDYEEPWSGNGF